MKLQLPLPRQQVLRDLVRNLVRNLAQAAAGTSGHEGPARVPFESFLHAS